MSSQEDKDTNSEKQSSAPDHIVGSSSSPQEHTSKTILDEIPESHTTSRQFTGDQRTHDDYQDILNTFGHPHGIIWDTYTAKEARENRNASVGELRLEKILAPNYTHHSWEYNDTAMLSGGTDYLAIGPPGSGKSNLGIHTAVRLMEENDEKIIWRASTARSEWLPLAPWTRVCLPEGVDVHARFVPKDRSQETIDIELNDVVREVVYYRNPEHLNHDLLVDGQFHVVYPDPRMRGLQNLYQSTKEKQYDGLEFTEDDPLNHWWFGYILARVDQGPYHWTSVMFDEIGDIAPEAARNDEYAHYQKVELFKDCLVDARKTGLSIFMFGHSEADIHSMIRRKIRWRIAMPGKANPTKASQVVGFNNVPMNQDHASGQDVGWIMPYNESRFEYPGLNVPHYPEPVDMTLKVEYS